MLCSKYLFRMELATVEEFFQGLHATLKVSLQAGNASLQLSLQGGHGGNATQLLFQGGNANLRTSMFQRNCANQPGQLLLRRKESWMDEMLSLKIVLEATTNQASCVRIHVNII